jgi:glycine hydroxymethyltransferase
MTERFQAYQRQVVANAKALADSLAGRGHHIISGGTDNHLMMIDLRKSDPDLTGKIAQISLDKAHITANKNTVPGETRSPFQTSGIRLGTPAVTSRGMQEAQMERIALAIHTVLQAPNDPDAIAEAKIIAVELSQRFPLPYAL